MGVLLMPARRGGVINEECPALCTLSTVTVDFVHIQAADELFEG